ncbi:MAG: hypothetical protein HYW52_06540 [Gemmatimonadetes bacterium]|nr:hypothetical protein [Gemmatimonadota bacterium]
MNPVVAICESRSRTCARPAADHPAHSGRSIVCHSAAGKTGSSDGHAAIAGAVAAWGAADGAGEDPAHPSTSSAVTSDQ